MSMNLSDPSQPEPHGTTGRGAAPQAHDPQYVLRYCNAAGEDVTTPACATCVRMFSLTDETRAILDKVVDFHELLEGLEVYVLVNVDGSASGDDTHGLLQLRRMRKAVLEARGLTDIPLDMLPALRGSLQVAVAGGLFTSAERKSVSDTFAFLNQFTAHVYNHHCCRNGVGIARSICDQLHTVRFVGMVNVATACGLTLDCAGKSIEEVNGLIKAEAEGFLEYYRRHIHTSHGGRMNSLTVLWTAITNALDIITAKTTEWITTVANTKDCMDLLYVSRQTHDQVFLVDELLGMGCWTDESFTTCGSYDLYTAIQPIHPLVDWDECPHLKCFMDGYQKMCCARHTGNDGAGTRRDE